MIMVENRKGMRTERHSYNSRRQGFMAPGGVIGEEKEGRIAAAMQEVMCIMEGKFKFRNDYNVSTKCGTLACLLVSPFLCIHWSVYCYSVNWF